MPDEAASSSAIPGVANPRRTPVAELTVAQELFRTKRLALGNTHSLADGETVPCGGECPHRLRSISCPFSGAPCLVGCTVKQVLAGEGFAYSEEDFFVVAQAGHYLVGEENIINLANPRATHLRIVTNKRGQLVHADSGLDGSLLDYEPEFLFDEVDLERATNEPGEHAAAAVADGGAAAAAGAVPDSAGARAADDENQGAIAGDQ